ncbi:prepilin-type N-terminal cleavage/methylation domain-containing protein [Desulfogranum mediterraneum]|uniref:prepilin-type N-terminal cleavage/methylation domain-containing protein n=1 Tax=Desulfogranum mediterraneum TaxID=160661 RepID=UPI000422F7A9|nr:prepilin-type N-terminal cleavage/methylation domain-containing protein [Desulfogranum mediterraneum]
MPDSRGFTLLELLLVMVLLAVTTSLALPRLSSFTLGSPLQRSARKLTLLISQSAQVAVRTSQAHQLRYEPLERTFTLVPLDSSRRESAEQQPSLPRLQLPEEVAVKDFGRYYQGVQSVGILSLLFSAQGYLEPALIHLQDEEGEELTLELSPFLSRVYIHQGYLPLEKELFH